MNDGACKRDSLLEQIQSRLDNGMGVSTREATETRKRLNRLRSHGGLYASVEMSPYLRGRVVMYADHS